MQINLEKHDSHSIQAYTENSLKIDDAWYSQNILLCRQAIITDWPSKSIRSLDFDSLSEALKWKPEIIIIGHSAKDSFPSPKLISELGNRRIGLEAMSIDAACRTWNVLLSERREVVLGIIW